MLARFAFVSSVACNGSPASQVVGAMGGANAGGTDSSVAGADSTDRGCDECPPYGAKCEDGVLSYRFSWGTACPPDDACAVFTHICELGCWQGGEAISTEDDLYGLCEEASRRGPGFPCESDIDCQDPTIANRMSNLNSPAVNTGGMGGASANANGVPSAAAGSSDELLLCSEEGTCELEPTRPAPTDIGQSCSISTTESQPGPILGRDTRCQTGACLVLEAAESEGSCTRGCATDTDCPADYSCRDVLDSRYTVWGWALSHVPPPRLLACVPEVS